MAFQDWASLELVKQAEHGLLEDRVPHSVPWGQFLCLVHLFIHSVSQSASSIPAKCRLLAGSWECRDGSGAALPLKSSQLPSWVSAAPAAPRGLREHGRGAPILHKVAGKTPQGKYHCLLETRGRGTPGRRNSMCKGHRLYPCSDLWGEGWRAWTLHLSSHRCTPEGEESNTLKKQSTGQGQRSWLPPLHPPQGLIPLVLPFLPTGFGNYHLLQPSLFRKCQ